MSDPPKRLANLAKHGMDLDAAADFDWLSAAVRPVRGGRFQAIGHLGDHVVSIVFRPLGMEAISIISMRLASRKERMRL